MDWIKFLLEKIQLASVIVILVILYFGYKLLEIDNSISSPAGILGCIFIVAGLVTAVGAIAVTQTRESYGDVIENYQHVISTLKSSSKDIQEHYKDTLSNNESQKVGEYTILGRQEDGTQKIDTSAI